MWAAHFAPALILKRHAPQTPIFLLAIAGALPDFLFMVFAVFGLETIKYHEYQGCFPYECNYPFTHSLVGVAALGLAFAGLATAALSLPRSSFYALLIATLSHWPLDVIVHRPDVSLTTSPNRWLFGTYLFNFPVLVFVLDLGITLAALYYHQLTNITNGPDGNVVYMTWFALFTLLQADFSFYGAPTKQARWLHAPLFAGQILAIAWGLTFLDKHTRPRLDAPPPQSFQEFATSAKADAKQALNTHAEKIQNYTADVTADAKKAVNTHAQKIQNYTADNNEKIASQESAM